MSQLRTQAPKNVTVIVSMVLVLLGFFGDAISPEIARNGELIMVIGYVLLLLGVFVKGL